MEFCVVDFFFLLQGLLTLDACVLLTIALQADLSLAAFAFVYSRCAVEDAKTSIERTDEELLWLAEYLVVSDVASDIFTDLKVFLAFLDERERLYYITDTKDSLTADGALHLLEYILRIHDEELEHALHVRMGRLTADELQMLPIILYLFIADGTLLVRFGILDDFRREQLLPLILLVGTRDESDWV